MRPLEDQAVPRARQHRSVLTQSSWVWSTNWSYSCAKSSVGTHTAPLREATKILSECVALGVLSLAGEVNDPPGGGEGGLGGGSDDDSRLATEVELKPGMGASVSSWIANADPVKLCVVLSHC
jgi:hypothetical protein